MQQSDNRRQLTPTEYGRLRLLDLSGNSRLKPKSIVRQLVKGGITTLEHVSLARTEENASLIKHIRFLMKSLLPNNGKLAVLEHKAIDFLERVEMIKYLQRKNRSFDSEKYRCHLALTCSATAVGDASAGDAHDQR